MRRTAHLVVLLAATLVAACLHLPAQVTSIVIKAGSPEDVALQQISSETDANKKIAEYKEFAGKFPANGDAVAYANWQIAQILVNQNQLQQALAYGEKALTLQPRNMEILTSEAGTELQLKQNEKAFDYCVRAGEAFDGIGSGTKPAGMTDDRWQAQIADDRQTNQPAYEYAQAVAYNILATEPDAKTSMSYIQRFNAAFPDSKYQDEVSERTIMTLENLSDSSTAIAYGEAVLEQTPNNLPTLVMVADAYVALGKPEDLGKGIAYAQRAIAAANADDPNAPENKKLMAGFAYFALGRAYMGEKRESSAVPELKHSVELLKNNENMAAPVLYELGRSYAMLQEYPEAKLALNEAVKVPGRAQASAKELLSKIIAAGK